MQKAKKRSSKQTPSYRSVAIVATVKKWPSGGCYASVPKDWIDKTVIISFPGKDGSRTEKVHGLGKNKDHAYVARIPCELAGEEINISLAETSI